MLTTSPYPGLRPYKFEESYLFFGRDEMRNELIDKLSASRFIAVVGESGCGKSSLVQAGVLPDLHMGFMPGAKNIWRIATMRPGNQPFENLAKALKKKEAFGSNLTVNPEILRHGFIEFLSLMSAMDEKTQKPLLPDDSNLLILVDQFEEIFRYCEIGNTNEAEAFVSLLLSLSEQKRTSIYVIITMRTDFLGDCAKFEGLPEAINKGQFLVPRLSKFQLRKAIAGPAKVFDCKVEEELISRLLDDVGTNPDYLPLVQHALMRLYEKRQDETITLEAYEQLGGFERTLSNHADEAFNQLNEEQKQMAQTLFRCLSSRERDLKRDTRNPTKLAEITVICMGHPEKTETGKNEQHQKRMDALVKVIDIFRHPAYSFITPPVPKELTPETILDISHESLIRQWTKMCGDPKKEGDDKIGWVKLEAKKAKFYAVLAENAEFWRDEGGKKEDLANKRLLDLAQDLIQESPTLAWAKRYDSPLANQKNPELKILHDAVIENRQDTGLLEKYKDAHKAWCENRFDLTFEWLEKSQKASEEEERKKEQECFDKAIEGKRKTWRKIFYMFLAIFFVGNGFYIYQIRKLRTIENLLSEARNAKTNELKVDFYKKSIDKGDSNFETINALASIYIMEKNFTDAINLYTDFLNKDEDNSNAKLGLAAVYIQTKAYDKANNLYENILEMPRGKGAKGNENEIKDKAINGKLNLASFMLSDALSNESVNVYDEIIKRDPNNLKAMLGLGTAYFRKYDYETATKYFREVIDSGKLFNKAPNATELINAWLGLGDISLEKQKHEAAIHWYSEVLKNSPHHMDANIGLFSVYSQKREYDQDSKQKAIKQFDKILNICLNLNPFSEGARIYIGSHYFSQGKYDEAIEQYEKILKVENTPYKLDAMLRLGAAYHQQEQYDKAIEIYKSALEEDGRPDNVYLRLGSVYLMKEAYENAEKAYDDFMNIHTRGSDKSESNQNTNQTQQTIGGPFNELAYAYVGKGYAQKGLDNIEGAKKSFEQAAAKDKLNRVFEEFNRRNNIKDPVTSLTYKDL